MAAFNGIERTRFGPFELSGSTGELLKQGVLLKLQPQPFHVLRLLVSRPGELVTREEIQEALWPNGTTVEFSQGLNFCIRQIRAALSEDAREPRFIETLPKRGYRFIAPVEVVSSNETGHRTEPSSQADPKPQRNLRWWLAGTAAAALLLIAGLTGRLHTVPKAILVRPLVNLGLPEEDAWFADALTQELVAALAETKSVRVIPWSSSMALKDRSLGARELGARFHVDTILEGSLRRSGDRLQLTTQLVDVASERTFWSHQDERDVRDLGKVQDDLLAAIAGTLKLRITEESIPPARRRPEPETYNLYLKALFLADKFSREDVAKSVDYFEEVNRRAPEYAPALAGLANALTILPFTQVAPPKNTLARAKEAALRALALDKSLAEAHAALAHALFSSWDWQQADREFQTALTLDRDSAVAHHLYSTFLATQGRADEAIREARFAVDLAPTSPLVAFCLAQAFFYAGHFDEAIAQGLRTLELDAHSRQAYTVLARAYTMKGMIPEALAALQGWTDKAHPAPDSAQPLLTAYTLAKAGRKAEALLLLRTWRDHSSSRTKGPPLSYVAALLACGDKEGAMEALRQSVDAHTPGTIWLKSTPELAPIRSDRRFTQALAQMNLD
jgi:TolB-like protein/DNA-binding winged helix-turn-helix (wHTH) protein/Tfp pilus assembly protein PilF